MHVLLTGTIPFSGNNNN